MKVLILNQAAVRRVLPMGACIELMSHTLAALARGETFQPLRNITRLPDGKGALGLMPGYLIKSGALGVKVLSIFHANHGTKYDSHQGAVLLFEGEHGSLQAILDASSVTAIRTAAVSALATRLLSREDASELAILGAGVQAITHAEAMCAVRPIRRLRVWTRTPKHAQEFARQSAKKLGIIAVAAATAESAVRGADIVCTVTASKEPVLEGSWLTPGMHINAVGSSVPSSRELDVEAVRRARLFVDRRESTMHEGGDFLAAKKEGAIGDDHIRGEIGEIVAGRVKGRGTADEITLFKSLGLAIEDVASAQFAFARAKKLRTGQWVEFGGEKFDWGKPVKKKTTKRRKK
ncbi:MAG: ornithine cyclodeaminase family protein [Gemmatimonadetes bacterium]|nr:ornithine cyclodeaminase family protein [Gemmatimonadota bacterium]